MPLSAKRTCINIAPILNFKNWDSNTKTTLGQCTCNNEGYPGSIIKNFADIKNLLQSNAITKKDLLQCMSEATQVNVIVKLLKDQHCVKYFRKTGLMK